jgi:regulator of protease activity HflC (stomatin/prohibitin superfamily)
MTALEAISWIVGIVLVFTLVYKSVVVVREKQNYVIEHFGKFHTLLRPGIHFIIPFVQRPKSYSERYFTTNPRGQIVLVEHKKLKAISTQNEVCLVRGGRDSAFPPHPLTCPCRYSTSRRRT